MRKGSSGIWMEVQSAIAVYLHSIQTLLTTCIKRRPDLCIHFSLTEVSPKMRSVPMVSTCFLIALMTSSLSEHTPFPRSQQEMFTSTSSCCMPHHGNCSTHPRLLPMGRCTPGITSLHLQNTSKPTPNLFKMKMKSCGETSKLSAADSKLTVPKDTAEHQAQNCLIPGILQCWFQS